MSTTAGGPSPVNVDLDRTVVDVAVSGAAVRIALSHGRELSVPLAWFSRLREATAAQRRNWKLIGHGHGIRWPNMEKDVSVLALMGRPT